MKRPNATGLRRIFWLAAAAMLALPARADSPFYTDDTNFSPGREIKMGFTGEHNSGSDAFNEVLDWNYAVVPNVRLNLTTYTKHIWPIGGTDASGYGDTEFKTKWRFLDEDPKSLALRAPRNGGWPSMEPGTAMRGASERLIPIRMTALVTALGLLPLAIGTGDPGREIEGPMAIVILGGLVSSTALNLLVLPTLALRFARFDAKADET